MGLLEPSLNLSNEKNVPFGWRRFSVPAKIVFGVLGSFLIPWPVFVYGTLFWTGSPTQSFIAGAFLKAMIYGTWTYPILLFAAYTYYVSTERTGRAGMVGLTIALVPASVPFLYLFAFLYWNRG